MSRKPRNFLQTNFFHVMTQGINKEYIFEKKKYKKRYIKLLYENCLKYNINIIAYAIMDNHAHLLLNANEVGKMSNFMKNVNEQFAMFYNDDMSRVGPVFRDRFKSEPIYDERYFYQCIMYILRNPVNAGMVQNIDEYEFSSKSQNVARKVQRILNMDVIQEEDMESIDRNEMHFIEVEEHLSQHEIDIMVKNTIRKIKDSYNIDKIDSKNKGIMIELVKEIRNKTGISVQKIADVVGISKSSVARYLKE